jgi:hypothetical protein
VDTRISRRVPLLFASVIALMVPVAAVLVAPQAASASGSLQVTTTSLPGATVGQPYSVQVQVTGGTAPYRFALIDSPDYPLPPGLSMSLSGLISGTAGAPPVNQPTNYTVQLNVSDSTPVPGPQTVMPVFTITLTPPGYVAPPPLVITTTSIPDATFNKPYSFQMQAGGGTSPYTWGVVTNLPSGFSLSSSGVISGQSSLPEQGSFTLAATDSGTVYNNLYGVKSSSQQSVLRTYTFTVSSGYPQLDPTLFAVSALVADSNSLPNEIDKLLAVVPTLGQLEKDLGNLLCDLTPVNGGLGCLIGGLP